MLNSSSKLCTSCARRLCPSSFSPTTFKMRRIPLALSLFDHSKDATLNSQIEQKSGESRNQLEELKKENVYLEIVSVDELFETLKCSREGLTNDKGNRRLAEFFPNKLEEKKESKFLKVLRVHVESFVMGHGGCCSYGYCFGQ